MFNQNHHHGQTIVGVYINGNWRSRGTFWLAQPTCNCIEMSRGPFSLSQLAIPAVSALIAFLAYTSQYFFFQFEQIPFRQNEIWAINIFASCIWICYYRSCTVDPGRVPKNWEPADRKQLEADHASGRQRWCRRCEAFKPPRAHHCRTCQR